MKFGIAALIGWTLVVVAIVLVVPGVVNTPGCASHVSPTPDCLAAMTAGNETIFWTHELPLFVVIVAGYLAVLGVAARRSRRGR